MKRLINAFWRFAFSLGERLGDGLRGKKKTVPAPLRSAGPSAEEAERPAMLPHKTDPVTPDRPLYFASPAEKLGFELAKARAQRRFEEMELEERRRQAIEDEIAEMIGPVKEGDPR